MDPFEPWQSLILGVGGLVGTLATAVATFFLWRVTLTLAKETTRMAEASVQPHVVVTLSSSRWSIRHFDLHIDNTGNATAYDIKVAFSPPLDNADTGADQPVPFQKVSVLKPDQGLSSYFADYESLKNKLYKVEISWLKNSTDVSRQHNVYVLDMADHEGSIRIGEDPMVAIARHLEKIGKSIHKVTGGQQRLEVDVFGSFDRLHEKRVSERSRRQWRHKNKVVEP